MKNCFCLSKLILIWNIIAMYGKFYTFIGCFIIFIAFITSCVIYVMKLKNEINDLQQLNLIYNKVLQEKDLAMKIYKKQIFTYQNTIKQMERKKHEYTKNLNEIEKIKLSDDKLEEFKKSLQ